MTNDLPRHTHAPDPVHGGRIIYRRTDLYEQTGILSVRLAFDRRRAMNAAAADREEIEAAGALCEHLEGRDRDATRGPLAPEREGAIRVMGDGEGMDDPDALRRWVRSLDAVRHELLAELDAARARAERAELTALAVDAHERATLSEGQLARLLGVDRVEVRAMADALAAKRYRAERADALLRETKPYVTDNKNPEPEDTALDARIASHLAGDPS